MTLVSGLVPNLIGGVSQQPQVIRLPSQSDSELNTFPSITGYQKKRPSTRHQARILTGQVLDIDTHTISRDSMEQYIVLFIPGDVRVFTKAGREIPVRFPDGKDYLPTGDVAQSLRCLTVNDYTFVVNTRRKVEMAEDLSPVAHPQALVFVKQASYSTDYIVKLDDLHTLKHSTRKDDNNGNEPLSSLAITTSLHDQINALEDYSATMTNSTILVERKDKGNFSIKVEDSRSNSHISVATDSVQKFADLPAVAPNGYVCEVKGDAASSFDNYFVRFRPLTEGDTFGQGIWEETIKPGIPYYLEARTMPHALVREADGNFAFKPLDWTDRMCGDEESVPTPSFVGRTLSSVFLYRNRLSFLSYENVIMSETGRFYNFFATTATTLVDSDPIDIAASYTKASLLQHAVSFPEGLILFSDGAQFKLEHPSDLLSMATVAVEPLTEFRSSWQVLPVAAGRGIFFAAPRGEYTDIREYIVQESTAPDAPKTTGHVPEYIPKDVTKLAVSPNEDILLVLSSEKRKQISVYKYLWNNNEKLQSAWTKWEFPGEVLSAAFHETEISLIVQYEDGLYLETLDIQPGFKDNGCPYEYSLDRKVAEDQISAISYSATEDITSFMLPYPVPAGADVQVVTRENGVEPPGTAHEVTGTKGQWVWAKGDLSKERFVVGLTFEFQHDFSQIYLRKEDGSPVSIGGRLQIRNLKINYTDTGYFEVHVTPLYRDSSVYKFAGRAFGYGPRDKEVLVPSEGQFTVPLLSKADQVKVGIRSRSFLPCYFVNAEWEGFYNNRSKVT